MATCGLSNSRNLLARKRLQKRRAARRILLESLESRQLMAVGPQLIGVQPNAGDLLNDGATLHVSPTELVFRFDDSSGIDAASLDGIRIIRSGDDGIFERASAATDFGTGGQTLVEFYSREAGEEGNGLAVRFTRVSRSDTRAPVIRVNDRTIDVELNSNPILETRVEDILQAFDPSVQTPATELVYALRLRGSQTIGIGRSANIARPLVLSGANAAKASTDFGLGSAMEVRLIARDSGNAGLGIQVNVTARDRGGAGNPIVSVVGKTINIEVNSNPRFPTTAQEFVDALNASDSISSSLIEAQLVSGSPATRVGVAPVTYSPLTLVGVSDIEIIPAYVGLGDTDREVVLRFAERLPDDRYRIEILGQGSRTLLNVEGEAFNNGISRSISFELDLGAQIESVVPQPVSRDASGALTQARNQIDVYFNDDDLIDVSTITAVNGVSIGDFRNTRTPLFFQSSDVITFAAGTPGSRGVLDANFYQLFHTADSLDNSDDVRILPSSIRYYPDADRVTLIYSRNLDQLTNPATGALLPAGELRLRVGTNEVVPVDPVLVDASVDAADTFAGATDLGADWTPGAGGSQSVLISSAIDNQTPLLLDFPGGSDEPGNRQIRFQDNLRLGADSEDGTSTIFYNFQGTLGVFSNTNLQNAITEQQKLRVREVLSLYEQYLGVRFVESANLGMTIAVGDTRAIVPFEDVIGSGDPGVIELNGPGGTTYEAGTLIGNGQLGTVLDIQDFSDSRLSAFAGPFQRAAMQAVGRLLGLGLADEVAQLTIQSFDAVFAPGVGTEIVLPGDADIVHGQFLFRPDSKDVDLYQFSLPVDGSITIEAFAERMSEASLLDSQIRLYQENALGGWEEIAANDDYYSSDSFLQLDLEQGNYIVGVSASGNASYDPTIADTGIGGRSEGNYQLRMDFRPPAQGILRDGTGTAFDGDSDGTPDGVFDFWFRPSGPANTKFVDKSAPNPPAATPGGPVAGSIEAPFNRIHLAIAAAQPGDVVRIVGNGGADNNLGTAADNLAYEIGFDTLGRPLPDGATLDVPKDVSVMIDAGAVLKMRRARIGVGSTSVNVDRSAGSLMVLGTPNLVDSTGAVITDSSGAPLSGSVYMTSLSDRTLGINANTQVSGAVPAPGDWGGIDFRNRVDNTFASREHQEKLGQFLNWVSNADIRYGGGQVVVDGVSQVITPIQMVDARPTVTYSTITSSAEAAMSATPNSFLESNFQSPAEQDINGDGQYDLATEAFTVDYSRVGPELNNNRIVGNSINGLQIRIRTAAGTQVEKLRVQGRFDDTDIVHYIPENLEIAGTPGGAILANEGPSSTTVRLSEQVGGTLPIGLYNYRFTSFNASGVESTPSEPTSSLFTFGSGSVVLSGLPIGINRIYRSTATGEGPYELVAEFNSNTTTFIDNGGTLGVFLNDDLTRFQSRLDARLTIDAGTVIKSQGARIDVAMGSSLIAEGDAGRPVVFTSLTDARYGAGGTFDTANRSGAQMAAPGDWGGIYVGHTSNASLDHAVVAYGGGTTRVEGGFSDFNAIEVHQGDLRLAHSRVENNANGATTSTDADRGGRGTNSEGAIFIRGAQPIIVDNIIVGNSGPAISANVSSLNSNNVDDHGRSRGRSDRYTDGSSNNGPLIAENRLDNNEINGLSVRGGELTTEGWWDDTDIVHVVLDEIRVPDHHAFSGLRLISAFDQSLVVKLSGENAGFTASGTPLDIADRIGGSVQIIGRPDFPVVLTSLSDSTVGAGFTLAGDVQSTTIDTEGINLLPTGPEVNNGTLIDNDVAPGIPGQFAFDVGVGGNSGFFQGGGGITAQGNTQLFVNVDVIFEYLNFIDIGGDGNAFDLSTTNITLQPTLVAPDFVVSEGNFAGPNGTVNWRVESTIRTGEATVFNTLRLSSPAPLGDIQFINYLDEDVQGVSDDILYLTGTPGEDDFRAFTLDGPERIGFNQGGIYNATPGQLENAVYEGWAADQYAELLTAIRGGGTAYTIPGNIDLVDLPLTSDAQLGEVYGPNDVTTAFAWRVDPNVNEAVITSFLELVPRNPASAATSGDWRSVLFDTHSNDRNVGVQAESESPLSTLPAANETPSQAQYLGELAPNEKAGDENRRLGFQIDGVISSPGDVDVYSFTAEAGTEVWLDIDRTNNSLDTVVELIDANGRPLALSDSSLAEEADRSLLFQAADMPAQSVNPLRKSSEDFYYSSAQGVPKDLYSTNANDAGLRVRLPGDAGANNLYHIRVRSSNLRAGDPASQLLDVNLVGAGLTKGNYQLQVRLSEVDEVPGSSVTHADIRFASNGLELVGVPGNSPLLGENGEVEVDANGVENDTFANAQALGNLLQTNRQAISVAGNIDDFTDVDWFSFDIQYERITPTALRQYFSTIIDVDYADGIGRPDTSLYVFDAAGNLILGGLGSGIVDDQSSPVSGADNSDLTRGSAGSLDPYIGAYELPAGRYFLAITNSDMVPAVLAAYTDPNFADPEMRLQPIEGIRLIAEDHIEGQGGSTALAPVTPILFPQAGDFDFTTNTIYTTENDSVVDYDLSDIALYVSQDVGNERTNIYIVNPFTGEVRSQVGRGNFDVQDIDFRPNGQLRAFDRTIESTVGGNVDLDTLSDYIDIDTGLGTFADVGDLGIDTNHLEFDAMGTATAAASDDGFNVEAITFTTFDGQERGFVVGSRPTPFGFEPAYYTSTRFIANGTPPQPGFDRPGPSYFSNAIFEFDENTGTATSAPLQDKQNLAIAAGAGSTIRDRGYIETFTLDPTGAIVTRSSTLAAREVTQTTASGGASFLIQDGQRFIVEDGAGFPTVFEFNLGPEVLVNYDPQAGRFVSDGMQFTLDAVTYEFDTGNIIVIDALSGGQLADGSTVRVRNQSGEERIFEFDRNGTVSGAGNVAVPYTTTTSQAGLVRALTSAINSQVGFEVVAQFNANSNRISLLNDSATDPVLVTGAGLSVSGALGVTAGTTRIPISEAATLQEFVAAIAQNVDSSITVSFDSGRMNFSGADLGAFGDLQSAGIFTDLGSTGGIGGGNIGVDVLASDTAASVAARIVKTINNAGIPNLSATLNGDQVQLIGVVVANQGPLAQVGVAPGGIVTGIAMVGSTMFAVSDAGGLYAVQNPTSFSTGNVATYISSSFDLIGIEFSGLVEGPAHTQNGELSQILFGLDTSGVMHAFDTSGRLQPIFANGESSIQIADSGNPLFGANGLTMSSLDFNLWHQSTNRSGEAGHGRPDTPNDTRVNISGGQSLYFGFQSPGANGVGDLTGPNSTGLTNSYNFPGGAAGAIESAPFDLSGINAGDLPTLYFTYLFDGEQADSDLGLGNSADDYMRDSLRVYAAGEDGAWTLLATNNDPAPAGSNVGFFDDEFDASLTGNADVQPLFDNVGQWRQARVPLDLFAGQENVTLRFEFSTNGSFGYGLQGGRGPEIRTVSGQKLVDGETFVVNGQTFEIEMGPMLTVPGASAIANGDFLTIEGTRYVFTDGTLAVTAPDEAVVINRSMNANQVADALASAIQNATISQQIINGLSFTSETNDTTGLAETSGINGQSSRVTGSGEIGDNISNANLGEDVDMIRIDVERGSSVAVSIEADIIGSSLDSFLRVFDSEGQPLRNAAGQLVQNDNFQGSSDSQLTFTAPESGTYYIGVSGAGNQAYNPNVDGFAAIGSTGTYNLIIDVRRNLTPIVVGNHLQLPGAKIVTLPADSPIGLQGALGASNQPVFVTADMTAAEVATAVQQSIANFFARGVTSAYPTNGNVVDLTGLVNYSSFDFLTGLRTPSLNDLDAGPFGATTNFIGDAFGAFNAGTNFDGTTNNGNPGALGAQNNAFEGVYLDDFIIGVAGRGEQVMRATGGNTNFVEDPQKALSNPDQFNLEILQGPYQFEIRGGADYGVPLLDGFPVTLDIRDTFEIESRTAAGTSIRFNPASSQVAGSTFTVGDGTRTLIFEMDDVNDNVAVQAGNIAVPFNNAVLDPNTGAMRSETAGTIAARVRDIINSSALQAEFSVSANLLNNDRVGTSSDTLILIGQASAEVPASVGETIVSQGSGGGANRVRPQGQIVIDATTVSNSNGFGVSINSSARDPLTNASVPGSPRNTVTLNTDRLIPGAVIMNSEFLFNNAGGISIAGDPLVGGVPAAAVPFVRLVNNTIVGGAITSVSDLTPTFHNGQRFDIGDLAFADAVGSYSATAGGGPGPGPGLNDATQALGAPNYSGNGEPLAGEGVVSLGRGGQLILEFTNNFLTGSGNADPDLIVFEVGDSEEVFVEVSADGTSFTPVGRASAASPTIDIDAFGFNQNSRIGFVRLTDVASQGAVSGDSVGADIDSVGAISSVPAAFFTPGGEGIVVRDNATATLLNNVVVNNATGISVDASSASTVIGGTVYQHNTINATSTLGQFPTVLDPNVPVFVDPANGNLYPAPSSPLIDSSIDSLEDRPSLVAVKQPLGISASPILAPQFDLNGQLRVDDPAVETPSGLGENVFKDRGAQDRADFVGPSVFIRNPVDNDIAGADQNPEQSIVELTNTSLRYFDIQIIDGLEPSDPVRGTGVDDSTVSSASVLLYRNNVPLVEGIDYRFGYDSTNGVIRLTPLAGIWRSESVYTVRLVNAGESSILTEAAASYTDGDQLTVIDASGSETTFEFDLGYVVNVPTFNGTTSALADGGTFTIDDGSRRLIFELDTDDNTTSGNVAVRLGASATVESAGRAIQAAIVNAGFTAQVTETAPGQLQIQGSSLLQLSADTSGLIVTGETGVQTVFGLQIPLEQGRPAGLVDGQTFSIDRSGSPVTFEIDTNGTVLPGNVPVQFNASSSAAVVGAALVSAIDGAGLGLSPAYDGNGFVRLGGDSNTRLDLAATALTQSGIAGQPAAVAVNLPLGASASEVAEILAAAMDAQGLSGITLTQFGSRLVVDGALGISGTGANQVGAIRDLAGNPLKANQVDGSTTLTIFLGEGLDYGDAPAPYRSLAADNGPRHTVETGLSLGVTNTADADAKLPNADIDDGLSFTSGVFAAFQSNAAITVTNTTGNTAFLSLWIDFNGDGFFEASETILESQAVTQPTTTVSFVVPSAAQIGDTYARVRLSTDAASVASPLGASPDGEVEDHVITVQGNPFTNLSNNLDVNGDGFVSPIDVLQVVNYLNTPGNPPALSLPATGAPPYLDVNGDGFVTPVDVLMIVNYLNGLSSGGGEGEGFAWGGEETVLASDWAPGIESFAQDRRSTSASYNANDLALLGDDDALAFAAGTSTHGGSSNDLAWAELHGSDEGEQTSLHDELLNELFS